jgi:hypothetical protein
VSRFSGPRSSSGRDKQEVSRGLEAVRSAAILNPQSPAYPRAVPTARVSQKTTSEDWCELRTRLATVELAGAVETWGVVERSLHRRAYSFRFDKICCNKDGEVTRVPIKKHVRRMSRLSGGGRRPRIRFISAIAMGPGPGLPGVGPFLSRGGVLPRNAACARQSSASANTPPPAAGSSSTLGHNTVIGRRLSSVEAPAGRCAPG